MPNTATAALVALNQLEKYEKEPHFKLVQKAATSVDGIKAFVQTFTYNELGNVDRPVWLQIFNAVQGNNLIVAQMQCASQTCSEYGGVVNQVFNSLKIAPLDKTGLPIKGKLAPAQPVKSQEFNKIINELEN